MIDDVAEAEEAEVGRDQGVPPSHLPDTFPRGAPAGHSRREGEEEGQVGGGRSWRWWGRGGGDRKSTRLNSSH